MKPVKRLIGFSKLKKGDYVRTFGTPTGDDEGSTLFEGHTAAGSINYLGTVKDTQWSWKDDLSENPKLIVHSAILNFGNSGTLARLILGLLVKSKELMLELPLLVKKRE